ERFPASLAAQVEFLDERLGGGREHTHLHLPAAVRQALLAQRDAALAPVRERRQVAILEAHTRAEARAALHLAADHHLRGVLLEPKQIDELVPEVHKAGVAVVAGPAKPGDPEAVRRGLVEAGRVGVPLAFGSGSETE